MGQAAATILNKQGHRTIGVDLHDADIVSDVGTAAGRQEIIDAVTEQSGGAVDGVVTFAGIPSLSRPGIGSMKWN